jgi:hypothetical protein
VVDLGENSWFRPLVRAGDGDILCILECVIEVNLPVLFATFRGNPRSLDTIMAMPLHRFSLGGINLGCVHRARDQWLVT